MKGRRGTDRGPKEPPPAPGSPPSAEAEEGRRIALGLALLAQRQAVSGSADARFALRSLMFDLDVNDPQITPALEECGVPASIAPALEDYVSRQLRPSLRQIERGEQRSTRWGEEALARLSAHVRGADPGARDWARGAVAEEGRAATPAQSLRWSDGLRSGAPPDPRSARMLAAIGLLEEAFGGRVTYDPDRGGWIVVEPAATGEAAS